ncbi:MAG TPA: DNA alkylation repair protein [Trueperaceae bacterium]
MSTAEVGKLVDRIAGSLRDAGTSERAASEKRYLKSSLEHYGASVPAIGKVAKGVVKELPELDRDQLLVLVLALWERPVHELRMAAVELLCYREKLLAAADVPLLERMLREARTWALVDTLAVKVVGPLARRNGGLVRVLDSWAEDDDFWLRRTVLLSFLLPLRRGDSGPFGPFSGYADRMLEEREFFIRKAIGWVLREYSKKRPEEVFDWLLARVERISGLTFREASKYLSEEQRAKLGRVRSRP